MFDCIRAQDQINLAAYCPQTRTHGPGLRSVIWVQGCPRNCAGCISPEWQERRIAELVHIDELVQRILARPGVTGLTLSGGEPMLQAAALATLIQCIRQVRDVDVICFTGYLWKELVARAAFGDTGIERLLGQVDVLIDGPFIKDLDNGCGLRGSTNQVVHRLTKQGRSLAYDFENAFRQAEIFVSNGKYLFAGIPPKGALNALEKLKITGHQTK